MAISRIGGKALKSDLARDSNLTFNTNTLVVDYTNGRIGIGVTSPTNTLSVTGSANVDNIKIDGNAITSTNTNGNITISPDGSGSIDVDTSQIVNVTDPTGAQHAATKAYVDSQVSSSTVAISNLDIDGGTDIGAALVDADLFIVDDGAGGTNRKSTLSRLKTYIGVGATAADDLAAGDAAINLTTTTGNITIDAQANDSDIIFKGTDGSSDTTFLTIDGSAAGEATFNAGIVIANAGTIGSASDKDAIAIASDGVVTFSQAPVFPDGSIAVADLDIDGATDIGAGLADADLFIVDDGAGGTNRKVTASRIKTYIGSSTAADDISAGDGAVNLTTTTGNITIDAQANDSDIIFKGTDGGADTTFLTIDGSAAGEATFNAGIVIADAGNIGSASDKDAIAIASDGVVTMNQIPVFSAGINVSGGTIAGTLATAAQTNITSLGTLTALQVDNLNINGNTLSSTAGTDLLITPLAGQQIVLDGTIVVDAGVVTGATSITSTAFVGNITGNVTGTADVATVATTVTITDNENTDESNALIFTAGGDVDGGNLGLESDGTLTYNPSTGVVTATGFVGALTGNVTGNVSGTAATVTTAAQTAITSLGTLTTLTVDNIIINGTTIGHTSDTDSIAIASNGVVTLSQRSIHSGGITIADGGNIGSASDTDAIEIAASGDVTFSQAVTITGNLTINGTTTSVSSTNTKVSDTLLELNTGATSNANDMGIIMERGSTGNNAIIAWDESADKFVVGTTTATADATGNISITTGALLANVEGSGAGLSAGTTPLTTIDIDGGTDIGAGLADADLFIVDDGAGGTNRKTAASRIKTYVADVTLTTAAQTNITSVGALDGGSITSNFGTINTGASAITTTGAVSGGSFVVADDGNIGSASDTDSIAIAANGVVTFSQAPVFPDGSINIADIDLDGGTDIGAAIVDADLFMVDDGAGGTMRKAAASRLKTYIQSSTAATAADDIGVGDAAVTITTDTGNITLDAAANDSDIILKGTDGGADTTFLTIDGSAAGKATFNNEIVSGAVITSGAGLIIADAGNIGSASDTDAIAIANDGVVTMNQIPVFSAGINVSGGTIAGTLATAAQANVTSLGTLTTLTVDNIIINGANIGHTSDTDSIAIASDGVVTFSQAPVFPDGSIAVADLDIDGGTDIGANLADADLFIVDDGAGGTNRKTAASRIKTYVADVTLTTAAQTNITSLGTLTALTVDDVAVNGKVMTMTGSTDDTAVFTVGTNGTLSIVTTDTAAAAANIQITADGTAELAGTTVTLDSSGGITLDADNGTITFADAGVSLGTINSSGYTGNVVGNVTGNVSGTAATVTTAAQTNITSLGTLTALTVDDVAINGKVITMTGSSSDTAVFTVGTNGTLSIVTTDAAAAAANIQITADGTFEVDATTVTLDSAGDIILDADGADVIFKDAGTEIGRFTNSSTDFVMQVATQDKDILFKGDDGGAGITALTLDMSDAGKATFNGAITGGGLLTTGGNIVIPDAGNIGSASDTDAIAIAADGVVTMNQIPVFSAGINVSGGTIAGTLATAAQTNITTVGTLTTLTVDNININANSITSTNANGNITISPNGSGTVDVDTSQIVNVTDPTGAQHAATKAYVDSVVSSGSVALTSLDIDGGTDIGAGLADADLFIVDDGAGGTNRKTAASRIKTYVADVTLTTAAQTNITSLGTLTSLTVDDVAVNGKVMTMTGSSSDTAVFTVGTNGTLSIVTTDAAAAAANITITADGTFEADGTTITLDSGGDIVLDADGADVIFKDAGTSILTITNNSTDVDITVATQDKDINFKGDDGGAGITALSLDMSDAGTAVFNHDIRIADGGLIGSASDADAMQIASTGDVTISQDLTVTGNLTINGTTVTTSTDNQTISDSLMELNSGASSNANDLGIVMERGSTGDNAIIAWDESADKFIVGTTTATGASTGNLSITAGTLVANIEGNVTGNVTGNTSGTAATVTTAAQTNITSLGTLTTLTVDDIIINGANIGHTSDTDSIAIASNGVVTFSQAPVFPDGSIAVIDLDIDGGTDIGANLADADLLIVDDGAGGTNRKTAMSRVKTYVADLTLTTAAQANVTSLGTLSTLTVDNIIINGANIGHTSDTDAIAIASDGVVTMNQIPVFSAGINVSGGTIAGTLATAAQTNITSLGTLTALTVDDVAVNGKIITMTGSSSDTAVFTVGTNGTLSIVTTDAAAAAANIQITADGTAELAGTTVTLDSGGDIVLDANGADVIFKDDGTEIGRFTNSSTDLVMQVTTQDKDILFKGDDGGAGITALTLDMSAAGKATFNDAITGGGLLTTGGNIVIPDAGNIGSASDTDAIAIANNGVVTMNQIPVFSAGINVSGGTIAGTLATAAQANVTSLGTLTTLTVDNIIINGANIGHTSDTDSIAIASDGVVTFSQAPVFPDGSIAVIDLDIDGATDIGAALADADLFIVDDGAGGTNRKATLARLKTYIGDHTSAAADDITAGDAAVLLTTSSGNITLDAAANDSDIIFKGTDGTVDTTFLTIDGSAAGKATFNNEIVSGAVITSGAGLIIADDGNIGSASDTDSIAIASNGVVTFSQAPVFPDGSIAVIDLDIDGGTDIGAGLADADLLIVDDGAGGTNRKTAMSRVKTYVADVTLTTAAQTNITSLGTLTTLTVDNIVVNGTNIGHTSDTDAIAIASDGVVTMNQIPVFSAGINVSGGTIAGTLATAAQTNITSLGTLTALTVDDVAINGKVMTMTGSSSDTAVFTVGTNGTLSIVTTDAAAAAANIQITADGTFEVDATTITLDSAGDIVLDADGADVIFKDAGTAIGTFTNSSSDFVIQSNVQDKDILFKGDDGGAGITALTLDMSAAGKATFNGAITGGGLLTTGGNIVIPDAGNIGSASDTDAIAIANDGVVTMNQIPVFSAGINVSGGTIAGTLATAAQANVTSLGTLTTLTVDNIIINGANIGHTSDTDSIAIASDGVVTFSQAPVFPDGSIAVIDLDIDGATDIGAAIVDADLMIVDDGAGGTNRKATMARLKTYMGLSAGALALTSLDIDGGTDIGANLADADLLIVDDGAGGTNRKTAMSRIKTYVADVTLTTAAQTNITSLGTLTALTVDDVAVNGKIITMTGSSSDTAVFTVGTNGTLSIVTTDAAAAAANIQITADGTFEVDATTVTLDSAGDIVLDADGADVIFKDAGTEIGRVTNSSTDLVLQVATQDKDILFKGDDGGAGITALTLDMSDAGTAVFNHDIRVADDGQIGSASDADAMAISAAGLVTFTQDVSINARNDLRFYDSDSSNYVSLRAGATVASNVSWSLPTADGTSGQFLKTDGAGNLSFGAAGSGGSTGFSNSTITTAPGASDDYDLAEGTSQDGDETPFEAGGQDAFGVSLGTVYDSMEPTGSTTTIDYGDGETHVGA